MSIKFLHDNVLELCLDLLNINILKRLVHSDIKFHVGLN